MRRIFVVWMAYINAAMCAATAAMYAAHRLITLADGTRSSFPLGPFVATLGFLGAAVLAALGELLRRNDPAVARLEALALAGFAAVYTAANGFGLTLANSGIIGPPVVLHVAGLVVGGALFALTLVELIDERRLTRGGSASTG